MQQYYTVTANDANTGKEVARAEDVPADTVNDIVAIMAHGVELSMYKNREVRFYKRAGDMKWEVKL